MATKVFLKWLGEGCKSLTTGREYEHIQDVFPYVVSNVGESLFTDGKQSYWQRIEREVFTAHSFEWFKHVPGDPMPCAADDLVFTILHDMRIGDGGRPYRAEYATWYREGTNPNAILGWRFADSEQKEPEAVGLEVLRTEQVDKFATLDAKRFNENAGRIGEAGIVLGKAWTDPFPVGIWCGDSEDESERNDLIAAVDDGHLTPGQKRHWDAMEEKQAERERAAVAKEKLDKSVDEKHIRDLAKANGAVKFEHDPRMGWPS